MKKITLFFVFAVFVGTNLLQGQKTAIGPDWSVAADWNPIGIPTSSDDVFIPDGIVMTVGSGVSAVADDVTVSAGGALTINPPGNLTLTTGPLKIESDATKSGSFIGGNYTGNISYDRYVKDTWHIISSMVTDQDINAFATTTSNDIAINTTVTPNRYALAPYNDDSNSWGYYTADNIGSAGVFLENVGYAFKRNNAGTINFTGTHRKLSTSTTITPGTAIGWTSVGNPYPSYIPLNNTFGNTTPLNFIETNTDALDDLLEAGYIWDTGTTAYVPINNSASTTRYIAPGQGFMVKSDSDGGTISITEAMQSHQSGSEDIFSRTEDTTPRILMEISNGTLLRSANVAYFENATLGLDPGYDAGVFTNYAFNIYTRLLDNSNDTDLHTQALPNSNYENMVIPVGVNADSSTEITISISASNLPSGIMVFLEDKEQNTFTRVDDGSTYATTHSSNGVDRFYVHTSFTNLTTLDVALSNISIYSKNKTIYLNGLPRRETRITLYDLLGRVVLKDTSKDTDSHLIVVNELLVGSIYVVEIETEKGKFSKKIIIQ